MGRVIIKYDLNYHSNYLHSYISDKGLTMDLSSKILSDLTVYSKYARYNPHIERRETWEEIVMRNYGMHEKKFGYLGKDFLTELAQAYSMVLNKEVLPSMRSLQFAGKAIELNNTRLFNCSYTPINDVEVFSEIMFLLLSGCGVGYSVQKHDVDKLPEILGPSNKTRRFLVTDDIIGWANAVRVLVKSYFYSKPLPDFDYRDIRPKGTLLKTSGGAAPGSQPLKDAIHNIQKVLDRAIETRGPKTTLKPIEAHDICCYIADAVVSGGIRRAACIALFSFDDHEMLTCKSGQWWDDNPQRGRANNSVVMVRHKAKKKHFDYIWDRVKKSGCGEPGFYFTNDKNVGSNPCCEIALDANSFCNLTTINGSDIKSQDELNRRSRAAAFIGTLQASYTDFHFLRDDWKVQTEKDYLIGVSITGIGSGEILNFDLEEASKEARIQNQETAEKIGIGSASRVTCIKPEGTASLVLGTSSGIHAWYAPYYIRRMRFDKNEPVYQYLKRAIPHLVEDDFFKPDYQGIVSIPVKAPEDAIYRDESALALMERVKLFHGEWIKPGHTKGDNTNNVSVTVSVKEDEWEEVGEWMWENRNSYNGISVLPYDGGTYVQAPFEEITEEKYNELIKHLRHIDLTKVKEHQDNTNLTEQSACSGNGCEVS